MAEHLLRWQSEFTDRLSHQTHPCPYCGAPTTRSESALTKAIDGIDRSDDETYCFLCGWFFEVRISDIVSARIATLVNFDINATEIPLRVVAAHLRRNFADIYSLAPERFERLIGDAFRDHAREPVFTKKTRDGGVDVFLINRLTNKVDAIIQCKRYQATRKVGIEAVQRLAGATLQWGTSKAYLVTTSSVSSDGRRSRKMINEGGIIELEFLEADDVLKLLDVYNTQLPSLSQLTPEVRDEIIRKNIPRTIS